MIDLNTFIVQYNGKPGVGDTPENDGQCVGLVEVWLDNLGAPHIWGNAKDLPANADPNAYSITSSPTSGDIVCYPAGWGGSPVGHTAIVVSGNEVFEQNDRLGGGDGSCRLYTLSYEGATFIHPKVLDQGGNMVQVSQDQIDAWLHGPDGIDHWKVEAYNRGVETTGLQQQVSDLQKQVSALSRSQGDLVDQVRGATAERDGLKVQVSSLQAKLTSLPVSSTPTPPSPISGSTTPPTVPVPTSQPRTSIDKFFNWLYTGRWQ